MSLAARRALHIASLGALLLALASAAVTFGGTRFVLEDEGARIFTFGLLTSVYLIGVSLSLKVAGLLGDFTAIDPAPGDLVVAPDGAADPAEPAPREVAFRRAGTLAGGLGGLLFLAAAGRRARQAMTPGGSGPGEVEVLLLVGAVAAALASLHLLLSAVARAGRRGKPRGQTDLITSMTGAPSIPPPRPADR